MEVLCSRPFFYLQTYNHIMILFLFQVLDFFNSRIDAQKLDGEWSVEKVLQLIIDYSRAWRGDGMKVLMNTYRNKFKVLVVTSLCLT